MNEALPFRILLIEDAPFDGELLERVLGGTSCQLQRCDRLEAGLAILRDRPIDLVLLDLALPDTRSMQSVLSVHHHAPHVPIVVLTFFDDGELGVRAVQSGAQDCLVKGALDTRVLVRAIRYAIERKRAEEKTAQLARELLERSAEIERDLELAREIQLSFVSTRQGTVAPACLERPVGASLSFAHRYHSSGPVGGDFFDIAPLSPAAAAVLICDAMGHGVRAALVTAMLRTLIQEVRPWAADPAQVLTRLNRGLRSVLRNSDSLLFATACYLVADAASGTVRLANAGHPSPLLVGRANGRAFALGTPDRPRPALGLLERPDYFTSEHRLEAGDRLILFTDGLFEVCERLLELAQVNANHPAEALLHGLLGDPPVTQAPSGLMDDVCVVVVDVSPPASRVERAVAQVER